MFFLHRDMLNISSLFMFTEIPDFKRTSLKIFMPAHTGFQRDSKPYVKFSITKKHRCYYNNTIYCIASICDVREIFMATCYIIFHMNNKIETLIITTVLLDNAIDTYSRIIGIDSQNKRARKRISDLKGKAQ